MLSVDVGGVVSVVGGVVVEEEVVPPATRPFGVRSHSSPMPSESLSFWSGLGWKQLSLESSTPSASLSTVSVEVVEVVDPVVDDE